MLPRHRAAQLLAWIFDDRLDEMFRFPSARSGGPVSLTDRIRVYEELQELQRTTERPRVLFAPQVPDVYLEDAADLRRLTVSIADIGSPRQSRQPHWGATKKQPETTHYGRPVMTGRGPPPPA